MGQLTLIATLAAAGAVFVGAAGCGGSDGGASSVSAATEQDEIAKVFDSLRESVAANRPAAVCSDLGAVARRQLRDLGHDNTQVCAEGAVMMLDGMKKQRRGGPLPDAEISGVEVEVRAIAKIDVDGQAIRLPFAYEGGRWKLDSFFGLSPRPTVAVQ